VFAGLRHFGSLLLSRIFQHASLHYNTVCTALGYCIVLYIIPCVIFPMNWMLNVEHWTLTRPDSVLNADRIWDCANLSLLLSCFFLFPWGQRLQIWLVTLPQGCLCVGTGSRSLDAGIFLVKSDTSSFSFVLTSFLEHLSRFQSHAAAVIKLSMQPHLCPWQGTVIGEWYLNTFLSLLTNIYGDPQSSHCLFSRAQTCFAQSGAFIAIYWLA